jgi:hypothetical protein
MNLNVWKLARSEPMNCYEGRGMNFETLLPEGLLAATPSTRTPIRRVASAARKVATEKPELLINSSNRDFDQDGFTIRLSGQQN